MDRARQLKIRILARGVSLSPDARKALADGSGRVVEREYPTTGGVTLVLPGDVYVNAPVDEWYCDRPAAELDAVDGGFVLRDEEGETPVRPLPLPAYLGGEETDGVMTHADRVRLSPIDGCSWGCRFCDSHLTPYRFRSTTALLDAYRIALSDPALPPRHALVSGGTPRPSDVDRLDETFRAVVEGSPAPVDVMMAPRRDLGVLDRMAEWGVHGLSINLEIFAEDVARRMCPQKGALGLAAYERFVSRAVELFGAGKVRSLLIVGLEPLESTLEGIEFLAALGCDPVLSPFRPAAGTVTAELRPPDEETLTEAYVAASGIVARHGAVLGPRCIPCQHNTVTFPDGPEYVFS